MYINIFILLIILLLLLTYFIISTLNIKYYFFSKYKILEIEKEEIYYHKEYYDLFKDNIMHKIGAITNESLYSDCFNAFARTEDQMSEEYDNTVEYTNYQMNKLWIESRANYSLHNNSLDKYREQNKDSNVSGKFVLVCEMVQPYNKKPILILNDPFGSVITTPLKHLSLKSAYNLIDHLLIVDLEFIERNDNQVRLNSIETTPFTKYGIVRPSKNKSIYKQYKFT
jgi:hypothetical protein